jgi:hypothetical protein
MLSDVALVEEDRRGREKREDRSVGDGGDRYRRRCGRMLLFSLTKTSNDETTMGSG